eukprot:RCo017569
MMVLWQISAATASHSVDSLSDRVFDVVHLQLAAQVGLFTQTMAAIAQMGAAAALVDNSVDTLEQFFFHTMNFIQGPLFVGYACTSGRFQTVRRLDTGERLMNLFDPGVNGTRINGSEPLLLSWTLNSAMEKVRLTSATPFNLTTRPWFTAVSSRNYSAAFSPVFQQAIQGTLGLSLGVPVRRMNGSLQGLMVVDYDLSTLQRALQSAHDALGTAGMLVLLAEDGSPIASSVTRNTTAIQKAINVLPSLPFSTYQNVLHISLAPFGPCFIFQLTISGQIRPDFFAYGLNWKLFVVLPQEEYYSGLWSNNRLGVILVVVCTVTFFAMQLFFYRFIL